MKISLNFHFHFIFGFIFLSNDTKKKMQEKLNLLKQNIFTVASYEHFFVSSFVAYALQKVVAVSSRKFRGKRKKKKHKNMKIAYAFSFLS